MQLIVKPDIAKHSDGSYNIPRSAYNADIAQLVEHQLPKLRVAGPSPVVRSSHTKGLANSR